MKNLDPTADTESNLLRLSMWWSMQPAQTTGLGASKGRITKGYNADLVVSILLLPLVIFFCVLFPVSL